MKYSQPDFYRFNEDSFHILDFLEKEICPHSNWSVADFGSGCGVLGIEYALKFSCHKLDFYEIQEDFFPYLKENTKILKEVQFELINKSFYDVEEKYDLILSNPPYFFLEDSRLPDCEKRQKCRFISKGKEEDFINSINVSLKKNGIAIFSFPCKSEHWMKALKESALSLVKKKQVQDILIVQVIKTDSF